MPPVSSREMSVQVDELEKRQQVISAHLRDELSVLKGQMADIVSVVISRPFINFCFAITE
jgi:hypothetical protein